MTSSSLSQPFFIKICGLKDVDTALECVRLGADAIGFVFFEKSPRNVSTKTASAICRKLPESTIKTGVFVDESFDTIMKTVEACGLNAVQLHGSETGRLITRLQGEHLLVTKALFAARAPFFSNAPDYEHANYFLVEYGKGVLPGGNAETWAYQTTAIKGKTPVIIAGGLGPDMVQEALKKVRPFGVDVSSGVESAPGIKDITRIRAFIQAVRQTRLSAGGDHDQHITLHRTRILFPG